MRERISLPAAAKFHRRQGGHAKFAGAKVRVLAGQHELWPDAVTNKRFG